MPMCGFDIWEYVIRYQRFFRFPPRSLSERRSPGLERGWTKFFDRWLSINPRTEAPVPLKKDRQYDEVVAEQARQYSLATKEFMDDRPEVVLAWIQRFRNEMAWMSTDEFRKSKRNSLIASFVGVFISHTGFYPTKISAFGLEFSDASRNGFCLSLILLIWYLWASYNMLLRDSLVEDAFLTIEHKVNRLYKNYHNRWVTYIMAQNAEKASFYRRIPGIFALYASLSLFFSFLRNYLF